MKRFRKLAAVAATMLAALALAVPAFAASDTPHTITITNEKAGHTYEAYQIFAGDISDGKLVNVEWGEGVQGADLLSALKDAGLVPDSAASAADVADALEGLTSAQVDEFAEIAADHLGSVAGTSTEGASPYRVNVVGDGYYLVVDKAGSVAANDAYTKIILKIAGDVEVAVKSDAPELTKKIAEGDAGVDANNGAIGGTVNYELTSKVPAMDGYEKYFFIVQDTLADGLIFNDDIAITVGTKTLAEGTDYTVSQDGQNIKIVFTDFVQYKASQPGADIAITYSVTIGQDAAIGNIGNANTAKLQYSNNPNYDYVGTNEPAEDDPMGETPEDIVITYVTGIEIIKVDEEGNRLTGAEFSISGEGVSETKAVDSDGVLRFDGLAEGEYVITEVTAPDGYNKLGGSINVTISCAEPDVVSAATDAVEWTYSLSGAMTQVETIAEDGSVHINVENRSGTTLPETGGIGTTIFYGVGTVLVLGAGIALVVKRRTARSSK